MLRLKPTPTIRARTRRSHGIASRTLKNHGIRTCRPSLPAGKGTRRSFLSSQEKKWIQKHLTTPVVFAILDDMRRQKPSSPIGRAELELLNYIHDHHPATVRDVADHLAKTRGIVRTTVLNMMARLVAKGYLTRKTINGIFHYSPNIAKTHLLTHLIKDFVNTTLSGSVSPFVAYLSTATDLNDDELAELKQLLHDIQRRHPAPSGGKSV